MGSRAGLIRDELPKAERAVKEGISLDEFTMMFNLQPEVASYWFEHFGGGAKAPPPPEPPTPPPAEKEDKPKLTPKAKKE